ncbi:Integral membrane protein [Penicillium argentinense]|uniref:Integral membrane protein n=1 Tax=Penicillium argentinense TaxID=1131581 RepID=A0A9W9FPR3_9EURO|nr:Integral membrane protein [Penicillium argentinense]KAJ5104196.1 Integral membrane protein [Penicillium argentinense]
MTLRWPALVLALLLCCTVFAAEKPIPTSASSSFPECGIECNVLNSAQDSCTAGAESTWTSCFCQSSLLTSLKTSGKLCSNCGSDDQATLSSWYNSYCKSGGSSDSSNKDSDSSGKSTATTTSTSTATAVASSSKNASTDEEKSWWSTHYQWVVMLIVLVVGFTILTILGVWFKRRYEAKRPGLYGGPNGASSSGALGPLQPGSGVLSPPPASWVQQPAGHPGAIASSLASSSRTDVAPKGVPPPSRGRLQKPSQSAADVEIRPLPR